MHPIGTKVRIKGGNLKGNVAGYSTVLIRPQSREAVTMYIISLEVGFWNVGQKHFVTLYVCHPDYVEEDETAAFYDGLLAR